MLDSKLETIKSRVAALSEDEGDLQEALLTICVEVDDFTDPFGEILMAATAAVNERFDSIQN